MAGRPTVPDGTPRPLSAVTEEAMTPAPDAAGADASVPPFPQQPADPLPRYGVDYTFAHQAARAPVHWPADRPVVVRLTGLPDRLRVSAPAALTRVLHELRALTGHDLREAEPARERVEPAVIPDGEIHVSYAQGAVLEAAFTHCADGAGLGGGAWDTGSGCYLAGFAVINADLVEDADSAHALTVLRHELGHAIGLGHAAQHDLVMHYRLAQRSLGYGPGDRHGLALLGRAAKAGTGGPGATRPVRRTPPCTV